MGFCVPPDLHAKHQLFISVGNVVVQSPIEAQHIASALDADVILLPEPIDKGTPQSRRHTFFSQHLLEHVFIQAEVSDHLLELPILFFELPKFSQIAGKHSEVFFLPAIEGIFGNPNLPTNFGNGRSRLRLL